MNTPMNIWSPSRMLWMKFRHFFFRNTYWFLLKIQLNRPNISLNVLQIKWRWLIRVAQNNFSWFGIIAVFLYNWQMNKYTYEIQNLKTFSSWIEKVDHEIITIFRETKHQFLMLRSIKTTKKDLRNLAVSRFAAKISKFNTVYIEKSQQAYIMCKIK